MTDQINFMDGFDVYASSSDLQGLGVYTNTNGVAWGSTYGRFGAGGLYFGLYNETLSRAVPSNPTAVLVGFAFNFVPVAYNACLMAFVSASGVECSLWVNYSTNQFYVLTGAAGTVQWTGPAEPSLSGWHYLEVYCLLGSGTSGIVSVQLDGATYYGAGVGINSNNAGGSAITSIQLGGGNNTQKMYVDDFYIRNLTGVGSFTWYGDVRIQTLAPTSDTSPNNGSPASGTSHYPMVASLPYNTSNYITLANTSGQEELYGFASLSGSPTSIFAVDVSFIVQKSDAGTASLEGVLSSGGTVSYGSSIAVTTSYQMFKAGYTIDPNTSAAWTASGVNAVKAGYKVP